MSPSFKSFMIKFLSAGSYPHAIMLLVRLFILLKLFLFARLRSTDDTMLLTEAGWCRCGWWCRWGATERWQCMETGRGRRHTGHPPQPRILHRLQCPQSTISCTISQPQLDTTLTLQHTTLYTSPSCKHLTLHLTLHISSYISPYIPPWLHYNSTITDHSPYPSSSSHACNLQMRMNELYFLRLDTKYQG